MPSCSRRTWYIIAGVSTLVVAVVIIAVALAVVIPKAKSENKKSKNKKLDTKSFYISDGENSSLNEPDYVYVPHGNDRSEKVYLKKWFLPDLPVELSDVTYNLYTQSNRMDDLRFTVKNNDVGQLARSYFNPKQESVFVVHGWTKSRHAPVNIVLRQAILNHYVEVNLFIVDWERPANKSYLIAHRYVKSVGKILGDFINAMQSTYKLTGDKFILVGHSLGAHVVGNAGAEVKSKVKHIVGLDPAGPLFTYLRTDNRLDRSDGRFVQVIHTDGGRLGFLWGIGHVDYYPNGGTFQPGCNILDWKGSCSHARAFYLYAESLIEGAVFRGYRCANWLTYRGSQTHTKSLCINRVESYMGQLDHDPNKTGDFYLETYAESPYAKDY